jgi:hypothetical protein
VVLITFLERRGRLLNGNATTGPAADNQT